MDTVEVQKREIVDLMAQVAEMESLKMRLTSEEEKYSASNSTVDRLKVKNLRFILSLNINVTFVRRPSIVFSNISDILCTTKMPEIQN